MKSGGTSKQGREFPHKCLHVLPAPRHSRPGGGSDIDRDVAVRYLSFAVRDRSLYRSCAVVTLIATALMTDYTGKDISGEYGIS